MEIKNNLLNKLDPYRTTLDPKAEAASARTKGAQANAAAPQGDRVSLSPNALLHTAAHAEAGRAPEVRQDKVEALKEQVASGNYSVDSRKIAEKLLRDETLLAETLGNDA